MYANALTAMQCNAMQCNAMQCNVIVLFREIKKNTPKTNFSRKHANHGSFSSYIDTGPNQHVI